MKKNSDKLKKIIHSKRKITRKYSITLPTDYQAVRNYGIKDRQNIKIDFSSLMAFQTLNKIKEIELKRAVRAGHKIRVAFFLDSISKFTGANVYHALCKERAFYPFVVLYSLAGGSFNQDNYWLEYQKELKILQERKFHVFPGYDARRNFIDLSEYSPDIVFVSPFYLDSCCLQLSSTLLNANYLVCQLNYGFNVCNNYEYHYNNRSIGTAWKYFVETREDFAELRRYSQTYGLNAIYTGSPKIDSYMATSSTDNSFSSLAKLENGNPIVVYAPHWTIKYDVNVHDLATFDLYHQYFLNLVKSNPQINFVFKPHPSLKARLHGLGIMTPEKYDDYISEWESLPNGAHIFDDTYIDLFRKSDLLITDSGSFIFEWLPTGKPCLYLVNPRRDSDTFLDGFSILAREIMRTYYLCKNKEDVLNWINILLHENNDPKKYARLDTARKIFPDIGNASAKIVQYLKKILLDD